MKEIQLTKGFITIVDEEDYDNLIKYRWYYSNGYASNYKLGALHRFIMNIKSDEINNRSSIFIDHINGDKLDNRKSNLRICNNSKNSQNRFKTRGKSKYKGVVWDASHDAWIVRIKPERGPRIYLGLYRDELEAAKAYNNKAIELFGEYANINVIDTYTTGSEQATFLNPFKLSNKSKSSTSKHKGVHFDKSRNKYQAQIKYNGVKFMKRFNTEDEAALWYNDKAIELFGSFAVLNIIE